MKPNILTAHLIFPFMFDDSPIVRTVNSDTHQHGKPQYKDQKPVFEKFNFIHLSACQYYFFIDVS